MNLSNEFRDIRLWARDRGIYDSGDIKTQCIKLQEEVGELARAILTENLDEIGDGIGDCVIVLTNLAELSEQHFCAKCKTCEGERGWLDEGMGIDSKMNWIECKDCFSL